MNRRFKIHMYRVPVPVDLVPLVVDEEYGLVPEKLWIGWETGQTSVSVPVRRATQHNIIPRLNRELRPRLHRHKSSLRTFRILQPQFREPAHPLS